MGSATRLGALGLTGVMARAADTKISTSIRTKVTASKFAALFLAFVGFSSDSLNGILHFLLLLHPSRGGLSDPSFLIVHGGAIEIDVRVLLIVQSLYTLIFLKVWKLRKVFRKAVLRSRLNVHPIAGLVRPIPFAVVRNAVVIPAAAVAPSSILSQAVIGEPHRILLGWRGIVRLQIHHASIVFAEDIGLFAAAFFAAMRRLGGATGGAGSTVVDRFGRPRFGKEMS